jgi:3alpha(or 20beta)-hydroxysteroid dehydrogenase
VDSQDLKGRTAIVTGASRGIGEAIARALAGAGANVVLTARSDAGEMVAAAIRADGGQAAFVAADQGEDADWSRVVAQAEATFGGLDILILNAGVVGVAPVADMSLEAFRALNRVNLRGAFLGLKHGVAAIRRTGRGGSVAIVSSIVGKIGVPEHVHYAASKAGVRMMAKAAALELGPEKIRVNTIHPGMISTEMIAHFPPEMARAIPLQRFGEADEVGKAALFLASDRSSFMTGAEIVIDGGWTAQ